ncbi:aldo/keto reductase [Flavobacterium lindanitolerans]|uniref:Aryl-alcohol dehydrogenase-like predicted oxidoreductase n=1 Tax=Flavobacterium lindanitolerans TaxID=428988 RepID=A0A497UY87_9FLAO|nr:aldo/keto reductase [Flavobacterium lindanitolerans]PKW28754.1 aryl-alcohol dehydrogenase-like predicted oxidoreductase [Flavobacterium lindanitolerans]RLJ35742.1 aryl-alcohol dehydrogenase-like predicted oxidoreductase [Flavobacterium lindanitolerans]
MEKRQLGNTDLHIYPVAFGGNVFGWTLDEKKSFEILNGFTEAGFNFVDTADVYSRWAPGNTGGESERIIGKWLKEKKNRHNIVLTTKVGSDMGDGRKGLKKQYILKAVEDSLQRLGTDYLDLYQTHFDDVETPVEETLEAYAQLQKDGKIRWIGTSNMSPERILASLEASVAKGLPRYETLQPHYNLYAREKYETQYESLALENGLGVITYFSLESGFLTGKYRTKDDLGKSPRGGDMDKYFDERGLKILAALDEISNQYKATPAAVSLAWLIQRPSVTAPIVSATSKSQLESIILAPELNLDADAIRLLDKASAWQQ